MKKQLKKLFGDKNNKLTYHSREYSLKKSEDGDIYVIDSNGEIVADVLEDDNEYAVVPREKCNEKIKNYCGKVKPIIYDGKIQNLDDFKGKEYVK